MPAHELDAREALAMLILFVSGRSFLIIAITSNSLIINNDSRVEQIRGVASYRDCLHLRFPPGYLQPERR